MTIRMAAISEAVRSDLFRKECWMAWSADDLVVGNVAGWVVFVYFILFSLFYSFSVLTENAILWKKTTKKLHFDISSSL